MNRLGLAAVLLACGLFAAPAAAAAPSPDPKDLSVPSQELSKAKELVRKLGSESFREREDAQDELSRMGRLAIPALVEAAAAEPSPEIRFRVARLLPRAETADLQARIDTFLADADGKYEHRLPAWKQFRREVYRNDAAADKLARELYVAMLKEQANLEILQAIETSPDAGGRAISDRRLVLYNQMNPGAFGGFRSGPLPQQKPPTLVDVGTLMFAEVVVPPKDIPRAGPFFMVITGATVLQQANAAIAAINNPGTTTHAAPLRTLAARWLDTRVAPEDLDYTVYVAQQMRSLKESDAALRRVVATNGVQGGSRGQALMYIVQQKGKDEVPFLKTLLKDDAMVTPVFLGNNGLGGRAVQHTLQMRDLALAMLIAQSGQKLQDYGFETQPGAALPNGPNIGYGGYAFTSDESRAAAFKKWADWEAKPKADEPKKDELAPAPPPKPKQ